MVFRMYSWFGNIYKQPLQGMPSLFSLKHALEKSFLAWHSQFCLFEMVHTFFPVINPLTSCTENDPLVDDIKTLRFALSIAKVIKARLSFWERKQDTGKEIKTMSICPVRKQNHSTDTNGSDNRCAGQTTVRYSKKGNTLAGGDYRSLCLPYRSWLIFL